MGIFSRQPVIDDLVPRLAQETAARHAAEVMVEHLQESMAAYELMLEDQGWLPLGADGSDFTGRGRKRARDVCRFAAIGNALVKRGLMLRTAYVWGGGVSISAPATTDGAHQDVNAVVQDFLDRNTGTFSGSQASEELERGLYTDGEAFLALTTADPISGQVDVRVIPSEEIVDVVTDPEDRAQPWLYLRRFTTRRLGPSGAFDLVDQQVAYPAVGYRRAKRWPDAVEVDGERWTLDQSTFVRHVAVNRPARSLRGIGDAFAALPWARGYKEFLESWSTLMVALSQYAHAQTTPKGKARQAAADVERAIITHGNPTGSGSTYTAPEGYGLAAVNTSGARFDADSGRPLAAMVAAAIGVPVTMLLGDPGVTGARNVAETLDQPTELEMGLRRKLWAQVFRDVLGHVIDEAVIAPSGQLTGRVVTVRDRLVVELPDQSDRSIDVVWPEFDSVPVDVLVKAISTADQTGRLPAEVVARLLLEALAVDDVDEIMDQLTDDQGRWVGPDGGADGAAHAVIDAFNDGDTAAVDALAGADT